MSQTIRTQISPVMFTCTAQDRPVATGHRMRPAEFDAIDGNRSFRCTICSEIHTWTRTTAWLHAREAA